MRYSFLFVLILSGCAAYPRVYDYKEELGFAIKVHRPADINLICGRGGTLDDGSPKRRGMQFNGCWDILNETILVADTCDGAKALAHELCHVADRPLKECDKIHWEAR